MIKILMLVNWKVLRTQRPPTDRQPPDYVTPQEPYWFYRYFREPVQVDVLDISSFPALERWEREKLRFYVVQALRAIPKRNRYDLIVSHGMQSGVVLSLWRRLFPGKAGHIVFDIGSFNSAAESGLALKLMQYASHSIDGVIYHTSSQKGYYEKCFPWLLERARFIRFGTDSLFFEAAQSGTGGERKQTDCLPQRHLLQKRHLPERIIEMLQRQNAEQRPADFSHQLPDRQIAGHLQLCAIRQTHVLRQRVI